MIKSQQIINESPEKNLKINQTSSPAANVKSQNNQVMMNMQTVLESILLELHQSKEDNVKLKKRYNIFLKGYPLEAKTAPKN